MTAANDDARVRGGRRKSGRMRNDSQILAQAAIVAAELERVRADPTIGPLRQAALETLARARSALDEGAS
jgi:hypothetical protein